MGYRYNPFTGEFDRVEDTSGSIDIETLTGNSGGAVGPDGANNVNILGSGKYTFVGSPGTNTLTLDDDGTLAETYTADSGSATPAANNLNILGSTVVAGSSPLTTTGAGSTITVVGQISQALAAADSTKIGLSNFDSSFFTVDADGFVSFSGSGAMVTITGDTGGALSPTLGNFNILGGTGCVTNGAASTLTINLDAEVPLSFPCDSGTATPAANALTLAGGTVVAGTTPVATSGSGSTATFNVQISQALAAADSTKIGLCNFDSTSFSVDADGFVEIAGTGLAETITGDSGGALPPTASNWNIVGGTSAAGTSPLVTAGAGSTLTINAQISQALASTDATKIGLSNFDSAYFSVDANGFVSTEGTGLGETITGDSGGALSPTAGNWNIVGGTSAAGTSPVVTSGSGSTLTANVQISQALASTDATKIGLSNFDSSSFAVDANGFVTLSGISSFFWTEVTGTSQSMAVNRGYILNNAGLVTATLPSTAAVGDVMRLAGKGAGGWAMAQNAGQTVHFGSSDTTTGVGGSLASTDPSDSIEILCTTANTDFTIISSIGNITVV